MANGLLDIFKEADLGDYGSFLGGAGKLGTGLYQMFAGNDMMDMYAQNMEEQLKHQKASYASNARQYNNELYRSNAVEDQMAGGKSKYSSGRQKINEKY